MMRTSSLAALRKRREAEQVSAARAEQTRANQREADGGIHRVERNTKLSRRAESATRKTVEKPPRRRWRRASALPAVVSPPGYSLKWMRIDGRERGDRNGVVKRIQEGWEFARKSDFPEYSLPTRSLDTYGECIGNGDMVLMKLEEHMVAERNQAYQLKRDKMTEAIHEPPESPDPRVPISKKQKSSTEFVTAKRKGRKKGGPARVAEDEDDDLDD